MAARTKKILSEIYDAWRARDLERAARLLADDFSLIIKVPVTVHPLGGPCRGKQAALERLRAILEQFEFLAYEPGELIVTGERAAAEVRLHYRQKETGEELETTLGHFWTVRGGKAVSLVEYHDLGRVQAFADKVIARI